MMSTYLSQTDKTRPVQNDELNSLLKNVREVTNEDWRVDEVEHHVSKGAWWWKTWHRYYRYQLLVHVGGAEYQVINFYREPEHDGGINPWVPAELVMAFLFGILSGRQALRKKPL